MKNQQNIIGQSPAFLDLLDMVSRVAVLNRPVLIIGERGTGKELIAERLHFLSGRWNQPFQKLNCAALPETLLESELFGYEPGAFTGANKQRAGRFEVADGGTLFLDEIGTMSPAAQEKLLRVIEYGEFERVGGTQTIEVDVRVIGATNIDLPRAADTGAFRHDLLDRLAFDVLTIPPLRARPEDIDELVTHFATNMARELEWIAFNGFTDECMQQLMNHPWPGNVRELRNVVERAIARAWDGEEPIAEICLDPFDSPWRPRGEGRQMQHKTSDSPNSSANTPVSKPYVHDSKDRTTNSEPTPYPNIDARQPLDLNEAIAVLEKQALITALETHRYNQRTTAHHLKLSYDQLRHKMKKYDLL